LGHPFLEKNGFCERMSQAECLCEAEKRMIHRIENVKAVEVCDVTKEVASTGVEPAKNAESQVLVLSNQDLAFSSLLQTVKV